MPIDYLDNRNSRHYFFRVKGIKPDHIRFEHGLSTRIIAGAVLESLASDIEYGEQLKNAEYIEVLNNQGNRDKFLIRGLL